MGFMDDAEIQARKWTRFEYDRLVEAEFFRPEDRIELIGGQMVVKEPPYSPHAAAITRIHRVVTSALFPLTLTTAKAAIPRVPPWSSKWHSRDSDSIDDIRAASMPGRASPTTGS